MADKIMVHRFVVTIRWEHADSVGSQAEWRGKIMDVLSGQVVHFRHIDGLPEAWKKITEQIGSTGQAPTNRASN